MNPCVSWMPVHRRHKYFNENTFSIEDKNNVNIEEKGKHCIILGKGFFQICYTNKVHETITQTSPDFIKSIIFLSYVFTSLLLPNNVSF